MTVVESNQVAGEKAAQYGSHRHATGSQQQMEVIGN